MGGGAGNRKEASLGSGEGIQPKRAVQLELATALVEVVRQLDKDPTPRALADAQNSAEELQNSLATEPAAPLAMAV
jgi:hypothetical protein